MAALEVVNLFYLGRLNCHGLLMSCFLLLTDRAHVLQAPELLSSWPCTWLKFGDVRALLKPQWKRSRQLLLQCFNLVQSGLKSARGIFYLLSAYFGCTVLIFDKQNL